MLVYARRQRICIARFVNNLFVLVAVVAVLPLWSADQTPAQTAPNASNATNTTQNKQDVRRLEEGKPTERELKGGEVHTYEIALAAGQYLKTVIEQKGIDVVVTLFAPDGKQVIQVDSPNGTQGAEPISAVAEVAGNYRLEVSSLEANSAAGRYEAKIVELRTATERDRKRIIAEQVFAQAEQLRGQGIAESLRQAIRKYEEALAFYNSINEHNRVSHSLLGIGEALYLSGEYEKAINYLNQALPLMRLTNDIKGCGTSKRKRIV